VARAARCALASTASSDGVAGAGLASAFVRREGAGSASDTGNGGGVGLKSARARAALVGSSNGSDESSWARNARAIACRESAGGAVFTAVLEGVGVLTSRAFLALARSSGGELVGGARVARTVVGGEVSFGALHARNSSGVGLEAAAAVSALGSTGEGCDRASRAGNAGTVAIREGTSRAVSASVLSTIGCLSRRAEDARARLSSRVAVGWAVEAGASVR